jgi:FKBP-type peptidyl-prolyl cis-trans isomerase
MRNICLICLLALLSWDAKAQDTITTKSGLKYIVLKAGEGDQAYANRNVTVTYIGTFMDGSQFDGSGAGGFRFVLGQGRVIKGWDEGIRLMGVGDKYRFIIPPNLAYGEQGYPGVIPPNATLIFEVELLKVESL